VTDALAALPAHLRKRLAQALDVGALAAPYSSPALHAALSHRDPGVLAALEALACMGVTNRAAAAWIRALDRAASPPAKPDLVWSGPEVPGLHARDTRRVYDELFGAATRSLWAVSYAYFDGPRVFDRLARRMEAVPELKVTLLLNIHRGQRDTSSSEHLVRRFADQFWEKDWPGKVRPAVFYPGFLTPTGLHRPPGDVKLKYALNSTRFPTEDRSRPHVHHFPSRCKESAPAV